MTPKPRARFVDQPPMSREHPSLATAVHDELNLAIALGDEGALRREIRHVPHVSSIDRSADPHVAPILQLRVVVRGDAASDHVTRTAYVEWTGVSRNLKRRARSIPGDVEVFTCVVVHRDIRGDTSLREASLVEVRIGFSLTPEVWKEVSLVPSGCSV
jgi:hypothetical protein